MPQWNRYARIGLQWESRSPEEDAIISDLVATTTVALITITEAHTDFNHGWTDEGSRQHFTRDDRLTVGDFLDWAVDEGLTLPEGECITDLVNRYYGMMRSAGRRVCVRRDPKESEAG